MHVPLHVLIIDHSPSRKDVHSISTEGQSALPTPSLGWLIPSSPTPNSFSIKCCRDTDAASLHVFFSQFCILNMTKQRSNLLSRSNRSVKRRSTANQQPNAHNHVHSDDSSKQRSSVHHFSSSPILIPLHSRRLHRARTQHFHIITSTINQNVFFLLGSTANEHTITFTASSMSCNHQDSHKGCKHILFLCHALGLIQTGDNHILVHPPTFCSLLCAESKPPLLAASALDAHTDFLCSCHACPPCFFCGRGQSHASSTLIICSKCGCLGHKQCFQLAFTPGSLCPRCSRPFCSLQSPMVQGHRNCQNVLNHFDCLTHGNTATTHQFISGAAGGSRCQLVLPDPLSSPSSSVSHTNNRPRLCDL